MEAAAHGLDSHFQFGVLCLQSMRSPPSAPSRSAPFLATAGEIQCGLSDQDL